MTEPSTPPTAPSARPDRVRLGLRLALALLALLGAWHGAWYAVGRYSHTQATLAAGRRDFEAALRHLAWSRWARPHDPDTWLLAARTARRAGKPAEAAEWLEVAKSKGARARAVQLERTLAFAQGQGFAEAEEPLLERLRLSRSDYPLVAEVLADEYMRTYRFTEARQILDRWVELVPGDVEAHARLGWVAEHQFDLYTALNAYRKVLEHEPGRLPVRLRVAEHLLKLRRPGEALESLTPAEGGKGEEVEVAVLLARCRRELDRLDEAEGDLADLPAEKGQSAVVLAERGKIALARGDYAEAEKHLRRALDKLPRERDLIYSLQQCLTRLGKGKEAEELRQALKQADADGRRLGDLMPLIARNPGNAELRYECAQIFLRNRLAEDGVRWLRLTLEADPAHQGAHSRLAEHFEKVGDRDRAERHREAARKGKPRS